ncbi:MAG: GNAT family N-acetyltransferase [Candidatus Omnitrophota bacterium]|jgi:GNAT superfamily N-acetyltransferase
MLYEVPLSLINKMADASAEAFISNSDPIGNFMFRDEPDHLVLKQRFFRSLVTSCSPKAVRQGISPELEAVSIWFPPGMDHSEDKDVDPFSEQDFSCPGTRGKMRAVNDVINILTENLGREPQWYLHLVAVRSHSRGRGYSSRLVRPMLDRAKSEGLPCTLITQGVENVKKYEHWGFKVIKEIPVPCSREKFYSMRKD